MPPPPSLFYYSYQKTRMGRRTQKSAPLELILTTKKMLKDNKEEEGVNEYHKREIERTYITKRTRDVEQQQQQQASKTTK